MTRTVVAVVSDSHGGHASGLVNPAALLTDLQGRDPRHPHLTEMNKWVWAHYAADAAEIIAWAGTDRLVVLHIGDLTQGNWKHDDLAEPAIAAQVQIAVSNFEPWRAAPNLAGVVGVAGTGWHEFGDGSSLTLVLDMLRLKWPDVAVTGHYHPLVTIDGVEFDLAHHGPHPGSREWLKGNILRLHTKSRMLEDVKHGRRPPAVMLWGHYHEFVLEVVTLMSEPLVQTTAAIMPPLCLPGAYALKSTKSLPYAHVGLAAFEIVDGELARMPRVFQHTLDLRRRQEL